MYRNRNRRPTRRTRRPAVRRISRIARSVVSRMSETKTTQYSQLNGSFPSIPQATWTEYELLTANLEGLDNINNRIGRRISVRSFYFKGILAGGQTNSVADDNINHVRLIVALWKNTTPLITNNLDIDLPLRRDGSTTGSVDLIRKYRDFTIILRSPGRDSTGYMPCEVPVRFYIRFKKPITITFQSTAAGSVMDKHLVVSMKSDSGAVPHPGFIQGFMYANYKDF